MIRRALFAATLALAAAPAVASAETELNVIPHGQQELGVPWAKTAGMLPANAQALMYDRLTPLGRNVTDAALAPSADGTGYFKSAKLLSPDDPSLITDQTITAQVRGTTVTARIRRDAYGVPHIYSDSDDGVIVGAGYVTAEDRSLLLDQARDNGLAGALDIPGAPAIELVLGLYSYKPTPKVRKTVARQQERSLRKAGADGRRVLRDIDTYLVGINQWYDANRPDTRQFDRTDIFALNAIKAQFLGEGGGDEIPNALFLDTARDDLGNKAGTRVYQDLRMRNDPETSTTTKRPAPHQTNVPVKQPKGLVRLEKGSFRHVRRDAAGRRRVGRRGRRRGAPAQGGVERPARQRGALHDRHADHGRRPADRLQLPRPDDGDGALRADAAGARRDLRPVPGLHAHRPRRGLRWTLTSAGADIIDTYAEKLCGGSSTKYVYKGKCRKMETVKAGTITKGDDSVKVRYRQTVHGPVVGYARVAGSGKRVRPRPEALEHGP